MGAPRHASPSGPPGDVVVVVTRAAGGGIVSNSPDGRSVTSKLAAILRTFSTGNVHSLSDIARSANLPVSTAHRLTAELAEWGFLERTDDKRYRVGMLVTHLGGRVWHEPNVQEHARRILDDLSWATRATVRLGVLEDLAVSYIEKRPDTHPASTSFETRALPAHATAMGKALLAFAPQETVDAVIDNGLDQYTPFTIVAAPALPSRGPRPPPAPAPARARPPPASPRQAPAAAVTDPAPDQSPPSPIAAPPARRRAPAPARRPGGAPPRQELRLNTAAVAVP